MHCTASQLLLNATLYSQHPQPVWCAAARRVPGGSAANVMKGLANISAGRVHCKFMGMVGTDAVAQDYMQKLKQQNVQPVLLVSRVMSLVCWLRAALFESTAHVSLCARLPRS
jgi:sugar/nucleoside kinase (ribokinase family)